MRLRTALIVGALAVGSLFAARPARHSAGRTQTYIVQMLADPAVAYDGGVAGIPATKPGKGKKIDPSSSNVQSYSGYLKGKHDKLSTRSAAARSSTTTSMRSTASRPG